MNARSICDELKSPLRKLCAFFHRSREAWRERAKDYHRQLRKQAVRLRDLERSRDHWRHRYFQLRQQWREEAVPRGQEEEECAPTPSALGRPLAVPAAPARIVECEVVEPEEDACPGRVLLPAAPAPPRLPVRPAHHHYPLRVMAVALDWLCRGSVSLRAAAQCFLPLLPAGQVPSFWSIRWWVLRLGLYELQRPKERAADWVFIVDSTIAIGTQKALVVLGARLSVMKARGFNLGHQEVVALRLRLLSQCQGPQVEEELAAAAQEVGVPRLVVSDASGEVKKGVSLFQAQHRQVVWNHDLTHRLALLLAQALGQQSWWPQFVRQVGQCRAACQQTPWAHLQPPAQRSKARWFNVKPLVRWGLSVIAYARQVGVQGDPFAELFGWLLGYEAQLQEALVMVSLCQEVCRLIKQKGVNGAQVKACARLIRQMARTPAVHALGRQIVGFLRHLAAPAKAGETLLGCSDVIESLFGKYKAVVERSPLRAITVMVLLVAALTSARTEGVIQAAMETVSTAQVVRWGQANGEPSLLAKRRAALGPPPTLRLLKGTKTA